jgi:hypothetical protein
MNIMLALLSRKMKLADIKKKPTEEVNPVVEDGKGDGG